MKLSKNNLFVKAWQFTEGNPYSYPTNWCSLTWKGLVGIILLLVTAIPGVLYYSIAYILSYFDKDTTKPTWHSMYCTKALWGIGLTHLIISIMPALIQLDQGYINTASQVVWAAALVFALVPVAALATVLLSYLFFEALPEKLRNRESKAGQSFKAVGHGLKKLKDDHCPLIEWEEEE